MQRLKGIVAFIFCLMLVTVRPACAEERVYFAGFGYEEHFSDIAKTFPNLSRVLDEETARQFDRALATMLPERTKSGVAIISDEYGSTDDAKDSYVLALILTDEMMHFEEVHTTRKLLVEVTAQAVVFDYSTRKIVWSRMIPNLGAYVGADTENPLKSFRDLLFDQAPGSLMMRFRNMIETFEFRETGSLNLQVADVTFIERARDDVDRLGQKIDDAMKRRIASKFSMNLSDYNDLPVLPPVFGHATQNKMAARMSNGEVFQLNLPEPDYVIKLQMNGFLKLNRGEDNVFRKEMFAVSVTVRFVEPLSQHLFFEEKMRLGVTRNAPVTVMVGNDWSSFEEVTGSLFEEFSIAVQKQDVDWARSHFPETKNARSSLQSARELIEKCR